MRRRDQDKVSLLEVDRLLAVDLEATRPLEDHAVEGLSSFRTANSPRTCAADDLGELSTRLKQRDYFSKWIDHDRTPKQETRTIDGRTSGLYTLSSQCRNH